MSQNQWWELLDASSNCYYYHNPHTSETVWERPDSTGGADIISLTKLQDEAETEGGEEVDAAGENGVTTETQQKESKGGQEQPALPKVSSRLLCGDTELGVTRNKRRAFEQSV